MFFDSVMRSSSNSISRRSFYWMLRSHYLISGFYLRWPFGPVSFSFGIHLQTYYYEKMSIGWERDGYSTRHGESSRDCEGRICFGELGALEKV